MNPELKSELELELEQHQISDSLGYGFVLDRRKFFQLMGGGVLVCLAAKTLAQESGRAQRGGEEALPSALSAWLHIGETGAVTVYTGKAELGQNIRTSLSQQIAEELHAPVESITLVMADTDLTPFDMGTFGSRTTPYHAPQLRNVAATARDVLLDMAAKRWNAEAAGLVADNGKIINPKSKQSISYGELTRGQELVKVMGEDPPLTPPAEWKVAGKPLPKVDGRAFVTGKHEYTSDLKRPGMLYGKVLRPSAFKATLASLDSADAEKMAGVTVVHDGNFVGVAAASEFAASRALAELNAKWDAPQQPSEAELFDLLKKTAHSERGGPYVVGSVADAMKSADHTVSQTYTVAYIAHSPLEPRAAGRGGRVEWGQADLLDRHPASLRSARRTGGGIPPVQRSGAGHRARHRLSIRRQAHWRRGGGSGAPGQGRRQAGKGHLDARGRAHLGLFPSGGSD